MIEDWRAYTKKIREQAEGERKHMAQDRERIQEVQAEERALWDTERTVLMGTITEQNRRIADLEREVERLKAAGSNGTIASKCQISRGQPWGKSVFVMEREQSIVCVEVVIQPVCHKKPRFSKSLVVGGILIANTSTFETFKMNCTPHPVTIF